MSYDFACLRVSQVLTKYLITTFGTPERWRLPPSCYSLWCLVLHISSPPFESVNRGYNGGQRLPPSSLLPNKTWNHTPGPAHRGGYVNESAFPLLLAVKASLLGVQKPIPDVTSAVPKHPRPRFLGCSPKDVNLIAIQDTPFLNWLSSTFLKGVWNFLSSCKPVTDAHRRASIHNVLKANSHLPHSPSRDVHLCFLTPPPPFVSLPV